MTTYLNTEPEICSTFRLLTPLTSCRGSWGAKTSSQGRGRQVAHSENYTLSHSLEISLVPWLCLVLWSHHSDKHSIACGGFLLDDQTLYIEPKHIFIEFEMGKNEYQEDSPDGKEKQWYRLSGCKKVWIKTESRYDRNTFATHLPYVTFKALANGDTLLRTHCCRHKCFPVCPRAQHLLRTQILFPDTKNVSDFVQ